jgi:protoheme IX farnesyltransferase
MHLTGLVYLAGALVLGGLFMVYAVGFARELSLTTARRLFYFSIIYLPLLLGLVVVDKIR